MLAKNLNRFAQSLNIEKYLLGGTILAAIVLRLYKLGINSLDLDEIGQVLFAKENNWWGTILVSAQHIGNTPLDYLISHIILSIGSSEEILRLPSVLWGVLIVVFVYLIAREIGYMKGRLTVGCQR